MRLNKYYKGLASITCKNKETRPALHHVNVRGDISEATDGEVYLSITNQRGELESDSKIEEITSEQPLKGDSFKIHRDDLLRVIKNIPKTTKDTNLGLNYAWSVATSENKCRLITMRINANDGIGYEAFDFNTYQDPYPDTNKITDCTGLNEEYGVYLGVDQLLKLAKALKESGADTIKLSFYASKDAPHLGPVFIRGRNEAGQRIKALIMPRIALPGNVDYINIEDDQKSDEGK